MGIETRGGAEPRVTRQWTVDELRRVTTDQRHRYELVAGFLSVRSLPGARHREVVARLAERMLAHARAHHDGAVFDWHTAFTLHHEPDTVRAPDLSFVCRLADADVSEPPASVEGAPDLAVLVLDDGDSAMDTEDRVAEYLAAGTRLVWIANPRRPSVAVHARDVATRHLGPDDVLAGDDVLPGFACPVRALFADDR